MWNVESLTNKARPHRRGMTPERLQIVMDTVLRENADVAVILETGEDAKEEFDKWLRTYRPARAYSTVASAVTGRGTASTDDPDEYGAETYLVLYRTKLFSKLAAPVVGGTPDYRGGVLLDLGGGLSLCALHAPSPSHDLRVRLERIRHVLAEARRTASGPLVFCGDLNIRRPDQATLATELSTDGLTRGGPMSGTEPARTSLRMVLNTVNLQQASEPYDQFWYTAGPSSAGATSTSSTSSTSRAAGSTTVEARVVPPDFRSVGDLKSTVAAQLDMPSSGTADSALAGARALRSSTSSPSLDDGRRDALRKDVANYRAAVEAATSGSTDTVETVQKDLENLLAVIDLIDGHKVTTNSQLFAVIAYVDSCLRRIQHTLLSGDTLELENDAYRWIATRILVSDHLPVVAKITVPAP